MTKPNTPVRMTRTLLLAAIFGFFYRGYMVYMMEDHRAAGDMGPFWDFVHGIGPAPFQYRVGVLRTAGWLYIHLHMPFRYGYSLLDLIGSSIAILLGYELLRRRQFYTSASLTLQWLASAAYVALVVYFVSWQDFYKKPETQPAAALVMLLLWLWSPRADGRPRWFTGLTAFLVVLLTLALSLIRADMALSVGLGVLAAAFLVRRGELSLARVPAMAVAGFCVVVAAGTQLVMMKIVYPHARPYVGPVCMLPSELRHPWEFIVFACFVLPTVWTLLEARRQRYTADGAGLGMLLATIPFAVLWLAIGRVEEVRIFLPLALANVPLVATLLAQRAARTV